MRYRILVGKPEGKRPLGRPRRRWDYICIFRKWYVGLWTGSNWLRIGKMAGTYECGTESSGSKNAENFLTS